MKRSLNEMFNTDRRPSFLCKQCAKRMYERLYVNGKKCNISVSKIPFSLEEEECPSHFQFDLNNKFQDWTFDCLKKNVSANQVTKIGIYIRSLFRTLKPGTGFNIIFSIETIYPFPTMFLLL